MKKLLVIALMMMYGFSSSGMTISFHYCCGKLKSVEWAAGKSNDCGKKHMMGSKPCCETKHLTSGSSDEHYSQVAVTTAKFLLEQTVPTQAVTIITFSRPVQGLAYTAPSLESPPLFIRNCVFRV